MFEFGRELRRLMGAGEAPGVFQDGLTGGDGALLELIDLNLLAAEAKAGDVAAGRVGARDRPARLLEAAMVWRELARRSGESYALRKAAAQAEAAANGFEAEGRDQGLARAKVEQALCAMLGAELYGDDGLNAAATLRLTEAGQVSGIPAALAELAKAGLAGRKALAKGDMDTALAAAAEFDAPLTALETAGRRRPALRLLAANELAVRADIMAGCGSRLKDRTLLDRAARDLSMCVASLDVAYEPLTFARVKALHGQTMAALGELTGDPGLVADGVTVLADALDAIPKDHSPLDWARIQAMLGCALQMMGDALDNERAFEQAITCFDRAGLVLKLNPALSLRAIVANGRALCLARSAELSGDLAVLDAAEAAFKGELTELNPSLEPVTWAVAQTNLARIYESRAEITGRDNGGRAKGIMALNAALEVFAEHGLRSLSDMALQGIERLREHQRPPAGRIV
ncbi:MAG: hypothetical protein JWP35_2498 [Caulobacter sp.]|nr:hypothetical protein [Caulobacter sp.]